MGLFGHGTQRRVVVGQGARRHPRFASTSLSCALGEVVDVSQSGLRVRAPHSSQSKVGDIVPLAVTSGNQRVSVAARVVWRRRVGLRGGEIGLEFVGASRAARAAIVQLARYGFVGVGGEALARESVPEPDPQATREHASAAHQATRPDAQGARHPAQATRIEVEDLYAILGVPRGAPSEDIRAAYRAAARSCHPDVCASRQSTERFALISKAYSVLRDPDMRAAYDRMLAQAAA